MSGLIFRNSDDEKQKKRRGARLWSSRDMTGLRKRRLELYAESHRVCVPDSTGAQEDVYTTFVLILVLMLEAGPTQRQVSTRPPLHGDSLCWKPLSLLAVQTHRVEKDWNHCRLKLRVIDLYYTQLLSRVRVRIGAVTLPRVHGKTHWKNHWNSSKTDPPRFLPQKRLVSN